MFNPETDSLGIGVDIEEIDRFRRPVDEKDDRFLTRIFCKAELDYCLAHASPYSHLAVRYAGKEAIVKALNQLKIKGVGYSEIEIINDADGVPRVTIRKEGFKGLTVKLSLSHTEKNAIAFALVVKS
jgi:holo-[acyl-carrier protein] synthase